MRARTVPAFAKTSAGVATGGSDYLPFKGKALAEPPKPAATELDRPPMQLGATVVGEVMSPLHSALPFKTAGSPQLPELTLEQYASLCAERNAKPDEQEATLRKYGVANGKAERSLDDQWKESFKARPEERDRWLEMVRQYTAWLENQR